MAACGTSSSDPSTGWAERFLSRAPAVALSRETTIFPVVLSQPLNPTTFTMRASLLSVNCAALLRGANSLILRRPDQSPPRTSHRAFQLDRQPAGHHPPRSHRPWQI